jgi:hypothetical protein
MHVDDESSEASDEEVRHAFLPDKPERALIASGGRILFSRFTRVVGCEKAVGGVFSAQVGFTIQIGPYKVLTTLFHF